MVFFLLNAERISALVVKIMFIYKILPSIIEDINNCGLNGKICHCISIDSQISQLWNHRITGLSLSFLDMHGLLLPRLFIEL